MESSVKFNLNELGYSSDDSIVDDLMSQPKFNSDEKDEKNEILEESIDDDKEMNGIGKKQINKSKRNVNRKGLLFDRATNGWFDKSDKFYKFKKLFKYKY